MLIPQIASGAAADLADVREAARAATDWVCAGSAVGALVPGSAVDGADWSLNGFGLQVGSGTPVGLAQGVARWLLDDRPARVVGPHASLATFDGLLVMGDGSAARNDKAPGHTHPRAVAFDEQVVRAISQGDATWLAGIDLSEASAVQAAGAPAWAALAAQVACVESAVVDLVTDPFGVLYVVARWTVRWADPA